MYVCTYVRMYVCTYVSMYVRKYIRMYVRTYVCTLYVCMYALNYIIAPDFVEYGTAFTHMCTHMCVLARLEHAKL